MSCIIFKSIPKLKCESPLSIARIPRHLAGSLETINLSSLYEFSVADFGLEWSYEIINTASGDAVDPVKNECNPSTDLAEGSGNYISILNATTRNQGSRKWVAALPCAGAGESAAAGAALKGPVHFSNPRVRSLSVPTFVPRASGSKQPESPEDDYSCSYFFKTTQVSVSESSAQIAVVNGFNEADDIAGTLNTVEYAKTTKTLPVGKYYVYAVDGEIVVLNHTFQSDIIPVLLISIVTVTVVDGVATVDIDQQIFPHTPCFVPVAELDDGVTKLTYALYYQPSKFELEASYTVQATCMLNNYLISTDGDLDIPISDSYGVVELFVYLKQVTVTQNTKPTFGFAFNDALPDNVELARGLLQVYADRHSFKIASRQKFNLFTFARIHINADSGITVGVLG